LKISFLVPDIAGPVLGPVTVLARTLQAHHEVEIVGPDLGSGVCPMYRGAFPYVAVPAPRLYRFPDYFREAGGLVRALTGDVIVAVKAFADTVPMALWEKVTRGKKVVVYLDEWDGALIRMLPAGTRLRRILTSLHHPLDEAYHPLVEGMIRWADEVISTSTFLQKKFGGRIVHMGVDMDFFKPQPSDPSQRLRKELGVEGFKLIVFGGVVRPHKGVEIIPEALARLGHDKARLLVVGPRTDHLEAMMKDSRVGRYIIAAGPQPKQRMPEFLDLADLVVLPLVDNLLARSQTPCKIFEAMSMAKPVIATAISDLPLILDGCGMVVPPGDADALAARIGALLGDEAEAVRLGKAAREKCALQYSRQQTEKALLEVIASLH
jgi:glycosyltransferase involved in cell wall biosynthesis